MPQQLPFSLLISWVIFFICAVGHFHHEQEIRRSEWMPTKMLRAVEVSQLLWLGAAASILIYYFVVASWYWPFVLAIGGSMLGALGAGLLFEIFSEKYVSVRGFILWPLSAGYAIYTIHGLP